MRMYYDGDEGNDREDPKEDLIGLCQGRYTLFFVHLVLEDSEARVELNGKLE